MHVFVENHNLWRTTCDCTQWLLKFKHQVLYNVAVREFVTDNMNVLIANLIKNKGFRESMKLRANSIAKKCSPI